ncbi:glycine betaine ABC transporter substrate-binding protein [Cellulomonas shaoxiangyii]|uniref:Glycine/betaine ABC transporter substrate-binding protein n=1 Tax=Cellulomonas shaoxiangyii TaxID=2566013 RepID=A0A4P7SNA5_9CELL|nr:glycine betaine ABC transporter substrate-binding protein [Cellulomonas shaoxiangyii]QCB94083.1 glycine/betaine ABC transporter substrate-binding protein [Cellulomonas shaoxiangyii]TGY83755.1 glycine/betaine ABC transporter substrate-binding protein [Cellulomonas shaoxiangyii]
MRTARRTRTTALAALAVATLAVAGCGAPGSGGGEAEPSATSTSGLAACDPVAGESLVVLEDDLGLQNADNVIPVVNAEVAQQNPAVVELLDSVSAALDTDTLIQLNKAVDIDRRTSSEVAREFVEEEGLAASEQTGTGTALTVGAANFSESLTLAEIYAEVLRSAGFDAQAQSIGSRETYLPALQDGTLAVVPEYAATLTTYLSSQVNGPDAESGASADVDETVAALTPLAEQSGLVVGQASAAQDQNAFAVTAEFAQEHDVQTLSELAEACGGLVLAGPPECPERPFCQPGLEETYGLEIGDFQSYELSLIGPAVRQGEAAIGLVLSSDGSLASTED